MTTITVIGGGLAGSEAAWQLAIRGYEVDLYEMRPVRSTKAHVTDRLAELVCSNSLGSKLVDRATGLLQHELRMLGSLLLESAQQSSVPAGGALAVDRELFAQTVTERLASNSRIRIIREEVHQIPKDKPVIIATGPLTSDTLAKDIAATLGSEYLYFYDAISPIVEADSIDMSVAFLANRYGRGDTDEGDYINCPMTKDEYLAFVAAIQRAEVVALRDFEMEDPHFFEGCIPIEQLAARGDHTLAYGPMRPVGLKNPHTGQKPYAVVQLRRDNVAGSLYNIVGFQTNMKWGEQESVLRMIPGLEQAEFVRLGQMHRNTFINSPTLLEPSMQYRNRSKLYFAGQITGIEGYVGNIATGLVAALNLSRQLEGKESWVPPKTTMLGALCHYITHADASEFQPMKANFGILPPLDMKIRGKADRKQAYSQRAVEDMQISVAQLQDSMLDLIDIPEPVFTA
jgi:methylenetetrahydrofolate--tRNA-(uracil-5-)-methyltransferase